MLEIALHNPRQHRQFHHARGPLTLARSDSNPALWVAVDPTLVDQVDALLQIISDGEGIALAATDCKIEWQDDAERAWIDGQRFPVPARFIIGDTRFEIADASAANSVAFRQLEKLRSGTGKRQSALSGPSSTTLTKWFAALGTLNRSANSLQELYLQAVQAAVDAIGLDGAVLLRRRDTDWEIAASHLPHPELGIHCDTNALDLLLTSTETLFQRAEATLHSPPQSPLEPPAIVVSPIHNTPGQLSGAIYGYRSVRDGNSRRGIRYLEAHLIELLAGAVSDGISRLEHVAESERRRVLLEQLAAVAGESNRPGLVAEGAKPR